MTNNPAAAEAALKDSDQADLRAIAQASIRHGMAYGRPLALNTRELSPALQLTGAAFVTLEIAGELRGCIGTLEARRGLAIDVADNAFSAAFRDPRFPPVTKREETLLDMHISVLTPASAMTVRDEEDLLQQLRPGVDGLILSDGARRATFLPSVWEQLTDKRAFLAHLKRKAGLPANHWSLTLKVERYTVQEF